MPGITNQDANKKKSNRLMQWYLPRREATKEQVRDKESSCAEIVVITLFEKFTYNFRGNTNLYRPVVAR